jgi:hypothetical protein
MFAEYNKKSNNYVKRIMMELPELQDLNGCFTFGRSGWYIDRLVIK